MSRVWSCNEWDPLEEVVVGNPLHARFPTPDPSTQVAEFHDRSLAAIHKKNKVLSPAIKQFISLLKESA